MICGPDYRNLSLYLVCVRSCMLPIDNLFLCIVRVMAREWILYKCVCMLAVCVFVCMYVLCVCCYVCEYYMSECLCLQLLYVCVCACFGKCVNIIWVCVYACRLCMCVHVWVCVCVLFVCVSACVIYFLPGSQSISQRQQQNSFASGGRFYNK